MPRAVRVDVEIVGHKELMRKLRAEELLAEPWAEAMRQAGQIGLRAAQGAAPVGATGMLRSKLVTRTQARPIPKWTSIKTTASRSSSRHSRYRYPKRLEYDPQSPHRYWLRDAINGAMGAIRGVLDGAARSIERKWNS